MQSNLAAVIDEIIVLHAGVAITLLNEFPDAFGATFKLDAVPPCALARADVPQGYAAEYGDTAFERRSEELLGVVAPRMQEIADGVASLGISLRDFTVAAKRSPAGLAQDCVTVLGAISGGLGSVILRREMLATKDCVLCVSPAEFHVVGIVEDPDHVPVIEEAGKSGLLAGLDHLIETNLILNNSETSHLRDWVDHFSVVQGACKGTYVNPVFRFIAESSHNTNVLYVAHELFAQVEQGPNIVPYDPERGFDGSTVIVPTVPKSFGQ